MANPKPIGDRTEARILAALLQIYPAVLLPFGGSQRYDLVFEDFDGSLKKVQSKTGYFKSGSIVFKTYSGTGSKKPTRPYHGEVDFFGVMTQYSPEVYLVPVNLAHNTSFYLRVDPPKNNQTIGINWAKEFLVYSPCG